VRRSVRAYAAWARPVFAARRVARADAQALGVPQTGPDPKVYAAWQARLIEAVGKDTLRAFQAQVPAVLL